MSISDAMDIFNKGGLLVWPILFCSLAGMTIFFERFSLYRRVISVLGGNESFYSMIASNDFAKAINQLSAVTTAFTIDKRIMLETLNSNSSDRETVQMVLIHAVDREITRLSKTLNTLAVFSSAAPLLGLLGTVIGMIKAFSVVESMGGSVNAAVLAGGIWEAMLTTAFGLMAAIPLLFFHNHLDGKLQDIQLKLEDTAITFMTSWTSGQTPDKALNHVTEKIGDEFNSKSTDRNH